MTLSQQELAAQITDCRCPFCGEQEIFVHAPRKQRPWWTVGCQSKSCDSVWSIRPDTGQQALDMLKRAQP